MAAAEPEIEIGVKRPSIPPDPTPRDILIMNQIHSQEIDIQRLGQSHVRNLVINNLIRNGYVRNRYTNNGVGGEDHRILALLPLGLDAI